MILILFFLLILTASAFIPKYVVILLVLNVVIGLFLSIFQIIIVLLPDFKPKRGKMSAEPFVSIFVPAYNEPLTILMQTLEALSRLKYDHFEVLTIDNNTKDPAVWKPVKTFTRTLREKCCCVVGRIFTKAGIKPCFCFYNIRGLFWLKIKLLTISLKKCMLIVYIFYKLREFSFNFSLL